MIRHHAGSWDSQDNVPCLTFPESASRSDLTHVSPGRFSAIQPDSMGIYQTCVSTMIIFLVCLVIFPCSFEDKNKEDNKGKDFEAGIVDSVWSPAAWKRYLNPVEWFRGEMSTVEAIVMVIECVS